MLQHDDRRLGQPELRRRQDAAVPSDHLAVIANQHRHGPAELGDAGGDARDLVGPVRLGVLRVRAQPLDRPNLDRLWREAEGHVGYFQIDQLLPDR